DTPATSLVSPLRNRRVARWLALAAAIGLVAVATYFLARPSTSVPAEGQLVTAWHRMALASFVGGQHKECELHADMVANHFRITSLDKAPAALAEVLGKAPNLGRLAESGLTFKGAGPCAVPGRGRSVHMVFEAVAPAGQQAAPALVSIFVQQD